MKIDWLLAARIVQGILIVFSVISLVLSRREGKAEINKFTLKNAWGFSAFFLGVGLLFSFVVFISDDANAAMMCVFSYPCLYAALVTANQRVRWDASGFWYRTAFRREIRYDYADVRGLLPIGLGRRYGPGKDLAVRVGGRLFILDETVGWERFAAAYANWQTMNKQVSWTQKANAKKRERYEKHGPFRRKLDRIPAGHFLLVLFALCGLCLVGVSIFIFTVASQPLVWFSAVGCLVLGLFSLGYVYAVAHLDDKPKLIKWYVKARIEPDPEKKRKKVYRRKVE